MKDDAFFYLRKMQEHLPTPIKFYTSRRLLLYNLVIALISASTQFDMAKLKLKSPILESR